MRRPLFQGSRRGTDGMLLSSMIVSSEPTAPSRLRSDQGRWGILCPVAGLLLKPTRSSSAANVHAIRTETLPVADRVMTVRRPCKPQWSRLVALGAVHRKVVPGFSDDVAPLRRAEVACLALASRAGEVS